MKIRVRAKTHGRSRLFGQKRDTGSTYLGTETRKSTGSSVTVRNLWMYVRVIFDYPGNTRMKSLTCDSQSFLYSTVKRPVYMIIKGR